MTTAEPGHPEGKGWIRIGEVGRPHGLRGAFFLKTADRRTHWDHYPVVLIIDRSQQWVESKVTKSYLAGGMLALQLECFSAREEVEKYYQCAIHIHRSDMDLKAGELIAADLKGLSVYAGQKGCIGKVVAVTDFGAQQNLEIEIFDTGKTVFFPLIEEFIEAVDVSNCRIDVKYVAEFFEG